VGFDQISEKPKKTKNKKKPFHNTTLFLSQKLYHPKQGKKIQVFKKKKKSFDTKKLVNFFKSLANWLNLFLKNTLLCI